MGSPFPFWKVAGTGVRGLERRTEPEQQHELSPSVPACVGEPAPCALPLTYWVPGNPITDPGQPDVQPSNYIVFPPLQLAGSCGLRFTGKRTFKTKKKNSSWWYWYYRDSLQCWILLLCSGVIKGSSWDWMVYYVLLKCRKSWEMRGIGRGRVELWWGYSWGAEVWDEQIPGPTRLEFCPCVHAQPSLFCDMIDMIWYMIWYIIYDDIWYGHPWQWHKSSAKVIAQTPRLHPERSHPP